MLPRTHTPPEMCMHALCIVSPKIRKVVAKHSGRGGKDLDATLVAAAAVLEAKKEEAEEEIKAETEPPVAAPLVADFEGATDGADGERPAEDGAVTVQAAAAAAAAAMSAPTATIAPVPAAVPAPAGSDDGRASSSSTPHASPLLQIDPSLLPAFSSSPPSSSSALDGTNENDTVAADDDAAADTAPAEPREASVQPPPAAGGSDSVGTNLAAELTNEDGVEDDMEEAEFGGGFSKDSDEMGFGPVDPVNESPAAVAHSELAAVAIADAAAEESAKASGAASVDGSGAAGAAGLDTKTLVDRLNDLSTTAKEKVGAAQTAINAALEPVNAALDERVNKPVKEFTTAARSKGAEYAAAGAETWQTVVEGATPHIEAVRESYGEGGIVAASKVVGGKTLNAAQTAAGAVGNAVGAQAAIYLPKVQAGRSRSRSRQDRIVWIDAYE